MTNTVFIDITKIEGLLWSDMELINIAAIGVVSECTGWAQDGQKPAIFITAPRDLEGRHKLIFISEEAREAFLTWLRGILSRKATLV